MKRTELVLLRGIPGSGKSTYAKNHFSDHMLLEADMYHMVCGVYQYKPENIVSAHDWCFKTTEIYLNNGFGVVVANTFVKCWEVFKYVDLANKLHIPCYIYSIQGEFESIHNVPSDVIQRMKDTWENYSGEITIIPGKLT